MRKVCHDFMARGGLAQYDVATKLAREMVSRPVLYVGPDDSVELDKFGDFRSGYEALSNSHRYMYHALGHVRIFLVAYQKTGEAEFLVRARRHVHDWIEDNFEETPEDIKYAYYDHGAAERLGVMCTIWSVMRSVNASAIDTAKIEHCLIAHARLLGSWSFTGRHQPVFIHNHLVFQAIYCLLAGILLNKHPESDSWRQHGSDILAAQVDGLISSDGVSIENSTGYHLGLYRVLRDCTALLLSTPIALPSSVAGVRKRIAAMGSFTERMRFSADRMPAIGDTRYTPNLPIEKSLQVTREQLELSTRLAMFPDAGYASIKDDVGGQREMNLTMIASALSQTHKHDDDLSITLSTNDGIQWIADPGFYKYDRSELSMYASSVMAHNAPYLADGQYEHKLRRAGLDGEEMTASDLVRVEGWHKHYPGVLVTRHLLWHSALSTLVIEDQVAAESRNETSVTVGFVLGDGITAERSESNSWTLWHRAFDISGPSIVFPDGSAICEDDATVFPMGRPTSASRLVITRPFVNGIARVQTIVTWSDLEPATLIDTVAHSRVRTKLD
ncbi:Heparinase II/III N-terminus [Paracoccus isoporae]|uniref:Heparinase II/III N-terminus n=2 Tax=Paracoccus isoporae TaxID=591205 RepID=A0A1G7HH25_9RHOB|nr:Heparinase II/III N-terminus [Paracoccus isoporae]